ncbi:MAG: carboxymuconolactone decarboxylase family protein [Methanotrichaceae archaeon]
MAQSEPPIIGADLAFKRLASEIMKDSALTSKEKAVIALACAVAVKCEHCVKVHKEHAMNAGASRDEILEVAAVAGLVRLGSGFNAASSLLKIRRDLLCPIA